MWALDESSTQLLNSGPYFVRTISRPDLVIPPKKLRCTCLLKQQSGWFEFGVKRFRPLQLNCFFVQIVPAFCFGFDWDTRRSFITTMDLRFLEGMLDLPLNHRPLYIAGKVVKNHLLMRKWCKGWWAVICQQHAPIPIETSNMGSKSNTSQSVFSIFHVISVGWIQPTKTNETWSFPFTTIGLPYNSNPTHLLGEILGAAKAMLCRSTR